MNLTEQRNLLNELNETDLLTLLVYGEARGEPPLGQIAVLWVVLNRAKKGGWFGKGISGEAGVVLKPFQFSCFNETGAESQLARLLKLLKEPDPAFHRIQGVVLAVLHGNVPDPTKGAMYYHTYKQPKDALRWPPVWTGKLRLLTKIGNHLFYGDK